MKHINNTLAVLVTSAVLLGAGCSPAPAPVAETTPSMPAEQPGTATAPNDMQKEPAGTPAAKPKAAPAAPREVRTNTVTISKNKFTPQSITVKVGTTVTWKNNDTVVHTVDAVRGEFRSGSVQPGKTFSYTFSTPGLVDYQCSIHPGMLGTVLIER